MEVVAWMRVGDARVNVALNECKFFIWPVLLLPADCYHLFFCVFLCLLKLLCFRSLPVLSKTSPRMSSWLLNFLCVLLRGKAILLPALPIPSLSEREPKDARSECPPYAFRQQPVPRLQERAAEPGGARSSGFQTASNTTMTTAPRPPPPNIDLKSAQVRESHSPPNPDTSPEKLWSWGTRWTLFALRNSLELTCFVSCFFFFSFGEAKTLSPNWKCTLEKVKKMSSEMLSVFYSRKTDIQSFVSSGLLTYEVDGFAFSSGYWDSRIWSS